MHTHKHKQMHAHKHTQLDHSTYGFEASKINRKNIQKHMAFNPTMSISWMNGKFQCMPIHGA